MKNLILVVATDVRYNTKYSHFVEFDKIYNFWYNLEKEVKIKIW